MKSALLTLAAAALFAAAAPAQCLDGNCPIPSAPAVYAWRDSGTAGQVALYLGTKQVGVYHTTTGDYYALEGSRWVLMPAAPIAPPASAVVENPKPMADDDDRFIARLLPKLTATIDDRAGQQINRRLEQIAAEIEKADPENPHRSAGAAGSVMIAAAIAVLVKKVVMAVIATIVLSILVGLLWKYWLGALIVYAIGGVIVPFVAGLIGGRIGR
jgi:F0F1-type ATP synthase assembly protein I